MIKPLFPSFLQDRAEYAASVEYWNRLWEKINPAARSVYGWRRPWLARDAATVLDGNPIFSAISEELQKGVRIIQHAPSSNSVEFTSWLDTFGGNHADPEAVVELVIACALTDPVAVLASTLIEIWVSVAEPAIVYTWTDPLRLAEFRRARSVAA